MDKVEIIAEIGINHGGSINKAHSMINRVAEARVDTVKFQTVNADVVYKKDDPYYKIFKSVELKLEDWISLKEHAEKVGLNFLSTPGDRVSADLLNSIGVKRFKIASDSAKDIDFVNYVLDMGKPVIVSTGMIDSMVDIQMIVHQYKNPPAAILHCISKYPAIASELNLNRIQELRKGFSTDINIGYSDHCPLIESAYVAVVKGATIIEKHFKWSDNEIDAAVSLDQDQLMTMVKGIRNLEKIL